MLNGMLIRMLDLPQPYSIRGVIAIAIDSVGIHAGRVGGNAAAVSAAGCVTGSTATIASACTVASAATITVSRIEASAALCAAGRAATDRYACALRINKRRSRM